MKLFRYLIKFKCVDLFSCLSFAFYLRHSLVVGMSLGALVYRNVTRRFSTLFLAATAGAYVMNYTFNAATDCYWDGVSVLFATWF